MEITWTKILAMIWVATKSVLTGGSPFAAKTVLFPTNDEGKYTIEAEGIRLAFTTHGGALTNLWMNDTRGIERDIVLGYDRADQYLKFRGNPFLNGVIGRYAGMISGAEFVVDGHRYQTSPNGNGGNATFNGGEKGWGRRVLDIASHSAYSITFVLFDKNWGGFPGTPGACITHTVKPYEWHIAVGLTPVRFSSPVSVSQQVFWNLDGFDSSANHSVSQHKLRLPFSGFRFAKDEYDIPTGDIQSNPHGSQFDFWSPRRRIQGSLKPKDGMAHNSTDGFNEIFMISRSQPWKKEDKPVATLHSPNSGIKMELFTDQEALRVHTWKSLEDTIVSLKKGQGVGVAPDASAVSLEMQNWPDAINHPEWHRMKETIWGTNQLYTSFSTYKFSLDSSDGE